MLEQLQNELQTLACPKQAKLVTRYFKIGPGEYAEHDEFIGIKTPLLRKLAKTYRSLKASEVSCLLTSKVHEKRLLALFILLEKYKRLESKKDKAKIYNFYVRHLSHINNWDLVDNSAPHIVGDYLYDNDRSMLVQWTLSDNLWYRRIAIVSTLHFIRNLDFEYTLILAEILLQDKEDLLHKAIGWMLREIGKHDVQCLENFLTEHYQQIPRTTLRYAIEHFTEKKRQRFLTL
ncbi:MAG: DNA alkylation repair protein [Gammaproteobacteria bacterium]